MGKKKNKNKNYVDPYEAAFLRAQNKIQNTSCDVSDDLFIDDNGDPIVNDDRDFVYETDHNDNEGVTPSYMDFIMSSKKKKDKKKKKHDDGDYDLITEEDAPLNTEAEINRIAKKGLGKKAPNPEDEMAHTEIPDDLKEMFPDMFTDTDETESSGLWFGPDGSYDDPYPEEEETEANDEEQEIQVEVNIDHPMRGIPEPVEESEMTFTDEPDDVPEPELDETKYEPYKPDWIELSKICAMHFRICEPLHRMVIDDGLAPTPVIDTVMNLNCFDVDQEAMKNQLYGEDGKLDLTYVRKLEEGLWVYLISSKHPAAVYSESEFMEAYGNIDVMDNKNFVFVFDDRNADTIGNMIYAYHIPANENRYFNNYVKSAAKGFFNDPEFFPGFPNAERTVLAELLVKVHIAEYISQEREIFPSHLPDYVNAFRMTSLDDANIPAFNRLVEFTNLVRYHKKTEVTTNVHERADINNITNLYDFHYIRNVAYDLFETVNMILGGADDDDEEAFDVITEDDVDDESDVEIDEDEDPAEALAKQIANYAEDETDYTSLINDSLPEQSAVDMADELYEEYKKTAKEQGQPVLSKEELASRMKAGVVGSMTAIRNKDGSAVVVSEPKEEEPPKVEEPKNDVGSNTMMEALAKAGCGMVKKPEPEKATSLGSVPVFRK